MQAAETGSGKTGAFGIPVLQIVYETLRGLASGTVDLSPGLFLCLLRYHFHVVVTYTIQPIIGTR
jgi:superfamily II DNA/RNA helicase